MIIKFIIWLNVFLNNLILKNKGLYFINYFFAEYAIYLLFIYVLFLIFIKEDGKRKYLVSSYLLVILYISYIFANYFSRKMLLMRPFVYGYGIFCKLPSNLFSYPSRHTLLSTILAYFAYKYDKKKINFIYPLLIGFARVACALHWSLDIIGGYIFGILIGIYSYKIIEKKKTKEELLLEKLNLQ